MSRSGSYAERRPRGHRRFGWLLASLAAALVGATLFTGTALAGGNDKVDVCHATGNGSYRLISVPERAAAKHVANHGDLVVGLGGDVGYGYCSTPNPACAFQVGFDAAPQDFGEEWVQQLVAGCYVQQSDSLYVHADDPNVFVSKTPTSPWLFGFVTESGTIQAVFLNDEDTEVPPEEGWEVASGTPPDVSVPRLMYP